MEMAISPRSLLYCWGRTNTPREGLPAATERTQNEGPTAEKRGNVRKRQSGLPAAKHAGSQPQSMLGTLPEACPAPFLPGFCLDDGSSASPGSYSSHSSWSGSNRGHTQPLSAGQRERKDF